MKLYGSKCARDTFTNGGRMIVTVSDLINDAP